MNFSTSLRDQIFFIIHQNPGILRTEIRDRLGKPNNVVTPAIKELVDLKMIIEGDRRISKTTYRMGRELYTAEGWKQELDAQSRLPFDE